MALWARVEIRQSEAHGQLPAHGARSGWLLAHLQAAAGFQPADKVQLRTISPRRSAGPPEPQPSRSEYHHGSVKLVQNCETVLFQRPMTQFIGFDKDAEADMASPDSSSRISRRFRRRKCARSWMKSWNSISTRAGETVADGFLEKPETTFVCHRRIRESLTAVHENPRYCRSGGLTNPRNGYIAEVGRARARDSPTFRCSSRQRSAFGTAQ